MAKFGYIGLGGRGAGMLKNLLECFEDVDIVAICELLEERVEEAKKLFEDLNKHEIDMIWAEAMHFYKQGEKLILEGDIQKQATLQQERHLEGNSKEGMIKEYLDIKLPKNFQAEQSSFILKGICDHCSVK